MQPRDVAPAFAPISPTNLPGRTRAVRHPTHLLQTPDTFVRTPLPGLARGVAIVHASPALGAGFLQYTAEVTPGGILAPAPHQRFLYVLEGELTLTLDAGNDTKGSRQTHVLHTGSYAYLAPAQEATLTAGTPARLAVIEKGYEPLLHTDPPASFVSHQSAIPLEALNALATLQVQPLLPTTLSFDFAVNLMLYAPGVTLPQVEIHVMEHGLLMLAGAGIYCLAEHWHHVQADDFIWMAPYCPQWFAATGPTPAQYLIYKDTNRVPAL